MKKLVLTFVFIFSWVLSGAQATKVRGTVTDADSGETVPFAGVYFKGTTIGVSADIDGTFSLETRSPEAKCLVCQMVGYETSEISVNQGAFTTVNFVLKPLENRLSGAVVKADNEKAKALLRGIERHRSKNDPERRSDYSVDLYNKMELDLSNADKVLSGKRFKSEFGFVSEYFDTSSVSGVQYLPVMVSETVAEHRHAVGPRRDRERILANRISGVNPENNLLSQFSGEFHMRPDFYDDFINVIGVEFPSPLQASGLLYYNYFIIDSLSVEGRQTYKVRFHPRSLISSPAFDGEMMIDKEEFALRSIHAKMVRGGNVNWLRDYVVDTEFRRVGDSVWFYKSDKMYADFSVALIDTTSDMSFLVDRKVEFREPSFAPVDLSDQESSPVKVAVDANLKSEAYWEAQRPYQLSEKEKGVYDMVERIKEQPLYDTVYDVVYTVVTGWFDKGKFGYGPILKFISFNNLEGCRLQFGIRTSHIFSERHRWTVYGAYGTADRDFKGGISYERLFSKDPTSKLTLDAHYDVFQLGRGTSRITEGNIISSMWGGSSKLSPMTSFSAIYDHEFSQSFNSRAEVCIKRHFANDFVPMVKWDGTALPSIAANEIHLQGRFSKDETVNRGYFEKKYLNTYKPVFYIDLTGSAGGLQDYDFSYFRPEITMTCKIKLPPFGVSKVRANAGTIVGRVPYPFLNIYAGNVTGIFDNTSFSCMDFFEYASDTWATVFWDHNFHGFFLGKIPLLRRLQLREVLSVKAAYGFLSERNNGTRASSGSVIRFPAGMDSLKVPYVEIGVGVTNILRMFRVEGFWRLTNLEHSDGTAARRPFVLAFGFDFSI